MRRFRAARRRDSVVLATAATLGVLMLAGCQAEAETAKAERTAAAEVGVLETSAGRYEFTPTTCAVFSEDGFDDIEIMGPGTTPDGESFFFELSSTANALSLGFGVDGPFASPERQLKAGRYESQEFTLARSGRRITATDLVLVDEKGAVINGGASLSIECGAKSE